MTAGRVARLAGGAAMAGLFLWLALSRIELSELTLNFAEAKGGFIFAAVAFFFAGYACRAQRWRLMLFSENPLLRWRDCAGPLLAGTAMNNVLPFRAGDVMRAFGFREILGVSAAASAASLVVERLLDLLMVTTFLGAGLAFWSFDSAQLIGIGGMFALALAAAILLLLLRPRLTKPVVFAVGRLASLMAPRLKSKVHDGMQRMFLTLEHTASRRAMSKLLCWSLLAWFFEGLVFWATALALPSVVEPAAAWMALSVGTFATTVPSTPGYFGTFDFFTARAMEALGNAPAAAGAFAFLVHAILWLPPTLAGSVYLAIQALRGARDTDRAIQ